MNLGIMDDRDDIFLYLIAQRDPCSLPTWWEKGY